MSKYRGILTTGLVSAAIALSFTVLLSACGGGGGGNGGGGGGGCSAGATCDSVGGIWSISGFTSVTSESSPGLCDDSRGSWSGSGTISQSGCTLTAVILGESFTGAIDGSSVCWTGSYPDTGGTTTETLSAMVSGNTISGTTTWSWSGAGESCSGTSTFTGTK
jgi:hypothetical protein